jgi:hypothetical protein
MLTNLRLGFATNSSSTHSIVILNPGTKSPRNTVTREFDWGFFTASSAKAKLNWLGLCVDQAIQTNLPREIRGNLVSSVLGTEVDTDGYVDHQSMIAIPSRHVYHSPQLDLDFIQDLKEFFARKDVVILGGNDNTEKKHPQINLGTKVDLPLPRDQGSSKVFCRRESPKVWTIFNSETGTRATLDFNDVLNPKPFGKLTTPLLVDLKITDFCSFGCAYCYQGSTPAGKHADLGYIQSVAYQLQQAGVFEVAIGGGEPTTHPKFVEILRTFRSYGITPNFSTRNLAYFSNERLERVLGIVGGFAVSIDSVEQAKAWSKRLEEYNNGHPPINTYDKVSIQYVLGSTPLDVFKGIVKAAKAFDNITLLGWKTTGRGRDVAPHDYTDWLNIVKKKFYTVGIDTCVAQRHEDLIKSAGIHECLYSLQEGQQSMYIDAVLQRAGASSFVEDDQYVPFTIVSRVADVFAEF